MLAFVPANIALSPFLLTLEEKYLTLLFIMDG